MSEPCILFIDMNSFFASCEQQANYYLRGRPVGICVYTGRNGCVIAASREAKDKGVKGGMRLGEAMQLCPELVPIETHPQRYRDFHIGIMKVLRKYSENVIPKSIDEAIVNLTGYHLVYKNPEDLARKIKHDIRNEVGDWLKCSIGIAPNAFLAKLATTLQKKDGLVTINRENIDEKLAKLKLTDLPGIASGMAERFIAAGIHTPLQIRHANPQLLKAACKGIVGLYWHERLNFRDARIDMNNSDYKQMQAMRHVSGEQRKDIQTLHDIIISQCDTLEKRMVGKGLYAREMGIYINYLETPGWKQYIHLSQPLQDGTDLYMHINELMKRAETAYEPILNNQVSALSITVGNFVGEDALQLDMFNNDAQKNKLRKTMYQIKEQYGNRSIVKANQLDNEGVFKDIIGFGSVKDM